MAISMTATLRRCAGPQDFPLISDFLIRHYQPGNRDGNWLQPIWEYAYTHPFFDTGAVGRIGIWEAGGAIVAVALYESRLGEAFLQVDPAYAALKPAMLDDAERELAEPSGALRVYVNDFDHAFARVVRERGYQLRPDSHRPIARLDIPRPFPPIQVRDGFRLASLAEENDLVKVDRALWRGFNHPGEPPADGPAGRRLMQSGPHFRHDLAIVAVAPGGAFVAYAGLWHDAINQICLVEPVATDPDYRRMGLGGAVVLEGVRRCAELGATVAYVGSDQPFYMAIGFQRDFTLQCWSRP